jgi:hypothetical protein
MNDVRQLVRAQSEARELQERMQAAEDRQLLALAGNDSR